MSCLVCFIFLYLYMSEWYVCTSVSVWGYVCMPVCLCDCACMSVWLCALVVWRVTSMIVYIWHSSYLLQSLQRIFTMKPKMRWMGTRRAFGWAELSIGYCLYNLGSLCCIFMEFMLVIHVNQIACKPCL